MLQGFYWITHNLAGSAKPGIYGDLKNDIKFLKESKIDLIINLTEEPNNPPMTDFGFEEIHFSIMDMGTPSLYDTHPFCSPVIDALNSDKKVLVHCKAGLGRTGTILACLLVEMGRKPDTAINEIRSKNPDFIQNTLQENYIQLYYNFLKKKALLPEAI